MRRFCPIACNVPRCTAQGTVRKRRHPGHATSNGTDAFVDAMTREYNPFPKDHMKAVRVRATDPELQLSSMGVGTYLGEADDHTDEEVTTAVIYSVTRGWNVIDTASNYRYGRAEVSVGHALDALLAGERAEEIDRNLDPMKTPEDITRDMLFISTKAGYLDPELARKLIASRDMAASDVVDNMHCMHPAYLNASLEQSLDRMNLETVDLFYLHNAAESQLRAVGRPAFMQRLRAAFKFLESARASGRIVYYGVASWDCFRLPSTDPGHLSLEEVVAAAVAEAGASHGLRFIQLPINGGAQEGWAEQWQRVGGKPVNVLQAAKTLGLGVFTSAPFGEGDVIKELVGSLDGVRQLVPLRSTASKLLHLARSTPSIVATLVGHKTREYVEENMRVALTPLLGELQYAQAAAAVRRIWAVRQQQRQRQGTR